MRVIGNIGLVGRGAKVERGNIGQGISCPVVGPDRIHLHILSLDPDVVTKIVGGHAGYRHRGKSDIRDLEICPGVSGIIGVGDPGFDHGAVDVPVVVIDDTQVPVQGITGDPGEEMFFSKSGRILVDTDRG